MQLLVRIRPYLALLLHTAGSQLSLAPPTIHIQVSAQTETGPCGTVLRPRFFQPSSDSEVPTCVKNTQHTNQI